MPLIDVDSTLNLCFLSITLLVDQIFSFIILLLIDYTNRYDDSDISGYMLEKKYYVLFEKNVSSYAAVTGHSHADRDLKIYIYPGLL